MTFSKDQLAAARTFAHTMIVVDDEPQMKPEERVPNQVHMPDRRNSLASTLMSEAAQAAEAQISHPLDTKSLVDGALELGLVCAIVTPKREDEGVADRVAKAALRADIVSLDWHMNEGDEGELASEIIQKILIHDEINGGRLRLISIYTGNTNRAKIFTLISERVNGNQEIPSKVYQIDDALVNGSGLRLVWREKAMGRSNHPSAIGESKLPEELLLEFSKLSGGLLTNVALAAISSMRDTTHHVLAKFKSELDAPYFHHRAFIQEPSSSMDYAVSIVLSALKAEVDKAQIAASYSSAEAVSRRIQAMSQYPESFIFRSSDNKAGEEKSINLHATEVLQAILHGYSTISDPEKKKGLEKDVIARVSQLPGKAEVKKNFSSLFFANQEGARRALLDFSFLTNTRSSELSRIHRKSPPKLDLGTVLHCEATGEYLLCLQASCDTVRGKGVFFFIPLLVNEKSPDYILPHGVDERGVKFVCLAAADVGYTTSKLIGFGEIDAAIGGILMPYNDAKNGYFVTADGGGEYRWLGNLKYKRALRTVQKVSQEMSRIGFDEFEPFRK